MFGEYRQYKIFFLKNPNFFLSVPMRMLQTVFLDDKVKCSSQIELI